MQHFQVGRVALEKGDTKTAIQEFRKVVSADPSLFQARVNLGLAYHSTGDYAHAVEQLAAARKATDQLGGGNYILGIDYLQLGRPMEAIAPLESAIKQGAGGMDAKAQLCTAYTKAGRFDDGASCATALYGNPPRNAEGWYQLGRFYLDTAQTLTMTMRRKFPDDRWTKQLNKDIATQNGNTRLAERFKSEATKAVPTQAAERDYRLLQSFVASSNRCFHQLLSRYPESPLAYRLQAETDEIRDNVPSAIENYQKAVRLAPKDATLHAALASLLLKQNRLGEAQTEAETILTLAPNAPQALVLAAKVDWASGNGQRAEERTRKALETEPGNLGAHELLGRILWKNGDASGAAAELAQALPLDQYGDIHYLLYRAYQKIGKTAAAQQALIESRRMRQASLVYAQEQVQSGAPEEERK